MSARKLAVQLLNRTEQEQSYSNLLLDSALSQSQLDERDKRLCASLYYGVIERRITLDAVLSHYSKQPLRKLDSTVWNILRLGIYQLLYCDQIPSRAAVNESVKLTRSCRKASASGFVNAVLRGFLRDDCKIPYPKDPKAAMAVEYAVPQWLLEKLVNAYGMDTTKAFLADALQPAPRFIRQNPAACTCAELEQALGDAIRPTNLTGAYELHAGDIRKLPEFRKGWFYVQDLSSQICALALGAASGETVLDLCAAPGGKSLHMGDKMEGYGTVDARDVSQYKVNLIEENIQRTNSINVQARVQDATIFDQDSELLADVVIADVPCSGYGVIGKKPEIKYRVTPQKQDEIVILQRTILDRAANYVKPRGELIFSTCTIAKEENEENMMWFLQNYPFKLESLDPYLPEELHSETTALGYLQLLPGVHKTDGFFIAKFRRK